MKATLVGGQEEREHLMVGRQPCEFQAEEDLGAA